MLDKKIDDIILDTTYLNESISLKKNKFAVSNSKEPLFICYNNITDSYIFPENLKLFNENNIEQNVDKFCFLCKKLFSNKYKLKYHINEHHLKLFYGECPYCKIKTNRLSQHLYNCKLYDNKKSKKKKIENNNSKNSSINFIKKYDIISTTKNIYFNTTNNSSNKILNDFLIMKDYLIGEGIFGKVYFGINTKSFTPVAIKIQKDKYRQNSLIKEKELLVLLNDTNKFPKYYHDDTDAEFVLLESLNGPNLETLKSYCGG